MAAPQVFSAPSTINIDGNYSEWATVSPVFKDPKGDVMHRNFKSYDPTVQLINTTGRNDIIESRATYDADNIYFYVKTVDVITSYTDPNWMLLFIDAVDIPITTFDPVVVELKLLILLLYNRYGNDFSDG